MAITRRLLTQNIGREMRDEDHRKIAAKGKQVQPARARMALGDIKNVDKENSKLKESKTQKDINKVETKKKTNHTDQNVPPKEMSIVDGMVKHYQVMSICEDDNAGQENGVSNYQAMSFSEGLPIIDIDKEAANDPFQCSEYAPNVFAYLKFLETKCQVGDYILLQTEINERMRAILIDWLIQVHGRFGLLQETLYLTVGIIDRFLECHVVSRSKLQLVGVSAMLLACKYEETYAPEIGDFVYISDNSYTKGQIKKMEQLILKTINYDLSNPLCLHFLRRNSRAAQADAKKHTVAKYLMELTIIDYKMARLPPSKIAAAALCLAGKLLNDFEWTKTIEFYSKYAEADLVSVVQSMANLVVRAESSKLQAVRTKYSSNKFMKVGTIPELKADAVMKIVQD